MKEIQLVNSTITVKVADEHFEVVNAYQWYYEADSRFAFRIIDQEGNIEYLHDFLSRRVAHWE